MDTGSRGRRGPRPPWPRPARVALVGAVMGSAALLGAACGASPSSGGSGGSANTAASTVVAAAVRYTGCMRSHGVPSYPDPNSSGQLPKIDPTNESQLGVSESRFSAAQNACQQLWPYQGPTQAQQRQELADALTFARCMRSHGIPNWPDPTTDPDSGRVDFNVSISHVGFNPQSPSPQLVATVHACEHGLPASMLPGSPTGVDVTTSP